MLAEQEELGLPASEDENDSSASDDDDGAEYDTVTAPTTQPASPSLSVGEDGVESLDHILKDLGLDDADEDDAVEAILASKK